MRGQCQLSRGKLLLSEAGWGRLLRQPLDINHGVLSLDINKRHGAARIRRGGRNL